MKHTAVKYVAELSHVREVSLLGTADLAFWKDRLQGEDLTPAERDGRAQILIIAADSRYLGVRFRELSFSVLTSGYKGEPTEGAYLVQAFNSCRFFAFCERALFSTPYYHGDVRVSTSPASVQLIQGGQVMFQAQMHAGSAAAREPSHSGEGGWEGPVFLPAGRLFFARVKGHTRTYPFLAPQDVATLQPSHSSAVLQALIDSRFAGKEWAVREDAQHAKSKTYARSVALVNNGR